MYSTRSILKHLTAIFTMILLGLALTSCGGGSSGGGSSTDTLSGTAAVGIPIDGTITVTDSLGATATAQLDASGNYTVDVTGMTPPFLITATPNDPNDDTQYSYASQANITVNVTPLTTLALFNANGQQDLATLLNNWASLSGSFPQSVIDAAQLIVAANFTVQYANAGLDPVGFNIFSSAFNADGTGFDGLLDQLTLALDPQNNTFTITYNGQPFSFDPNIDTGGNNGGGNGGSGSGNYGSLTLSGSGTGDLPFTTFTPTDLQVSDVVGVVSYTWSVTSGQNNYALMVTTTGGSVVSAAFTVTVPDGGGTATSGWSSVSFSGITLNSGTMNFSNVTWTGTGDPLAATPTQTNLTLNGGLNTTP